MGKDFGDDVIPFGNGYLRTSDWSPQATASWAVLIYAARELLEYAILENQQPIWKIGYGIGGHDILVSFLPRASAMGRRWTAGMRGQNSHLWDILRLENGTTLLNSD